MPSDVNVRDDLLILVVINWVPRLRDQQRGDSKDRKLRQGDPAIALGLAYSRHHVAPMDLDFRRVERFAEERGAAGPGFGPTRSDSGFALF